MGAAGYLAICMLMWGLATFTMKVAGQHLDPMTVVVYNLLGYFLVGAFLLPAASYGFSRYHAMGIAIGALFVLGNMALYKLSQTVQVSAFNDSDSEGPHTSLISHTVTVDNDGNYSGVSRDLAVDVVDDERWCGDSGTEYQDADIDRDCYVNLIDLGVMAAEWLMCTDPADPIDCPSN